MDPDPTTEIFASDDGTATWWVNDIGQEPYIHDKARQTLRLTGLAQRVAYAGDLRAEHPMVTYRHEADQ